MKTSTIRKRHEIFAHGQIKYLALAVVAIAVVITIVVIIAFLLKNIIT